MAEPIEEKRHMCFKGPALDKFEQLRAAVKLAHNPELAKREGSNVFQVWSDGEVTLTKSGSLLGSRGLHQLLPPTGNDTPADIWPLFRGSHGFAYVGEADAMAISNIIARLS